MREQRLERRVVTALFVDVVGSTTLTLALGPERVKRALDRAFAELATLIAAEGGTVEKYIGDAIHALFGVPATHPDDPQRALRAAHACVEWAAAARAHASVPLEVRAGVETGEAIIDLAATETERQQMSIGACVNVAARLQQVAEPGQVVVGPTCREANTEVAELIGLGDVDLKGLGRLPAWRLVAFVRPRAGGRVPFVGREPELGLLRLAYARARSGRGVLALVSGPPGQGKSRLVDEFIAGLGAEPRVVKARCRPAGESEAGSPLRQLLATENTTLSTEDLAVGLTGLLPDATERHRVATALGHSAGLTVSRELAGLPAGQRQDEIVNGWRRYLGMLTRAGSVVMWIDDLHWADGEVVQLLDRLTLGAEIPVLVVATARPELSAQGGLRPGGDRFFLTLDALDEGAARSLARHAGSADASGIERAEGNPLFVIELARARALGIERHVPLTLNGVIGARLEELPPPDRELLQCAAIVGETFTARDVARLSGRDPIEVAGALERLAELLYLHRVSGGYRFHHALVRDVAYGRLTAADRMRLHARYAQAGVPPDDVEILAHHLWEAVGPADADWVWEGSGDLPGLRQAALHAHLVAGGRYVDRAAYARAVDTCRRAIRFASDPGNVARVEQAIADAYTAGGEADEAWAHYLRARDVRRDAGTDPPADLYPSLLELPVYTSGMFRQPPADGVVGALLREGKDVARRAGDEGSLARLLALDAYRSHDPTQLVEALRLSEGLSDSAPLASCLEHAAILQSRVGEFAMAERLYKRLDALDPASVPADRKLEFRAILALNTGRLVEAERLAARLLTASVSRGPHLRTHSYREQCHVLLARGDWRALRELAAQTEQLVTAHPGTAFCYAVTTARAFAVVAHALEGQPAEARALLPRAEMPLQAEPLERESVLLLAYGAVGARADVARLRRQVREQGETQFWFFHRMEAVVLAMLERWRDLAEALPLLERVAARGSPYLEALLEAIREEMAAARGGAAVPAHAKLRELGYVGWSQLLRYRPPVASAPLT
jgi:class 3 adenylate cyclase/tetratricopeptide (TPR) repeat protein